MHMIVLRLIASFDFWYRLHAIDRVRTKKGKPPGANKSQWWHVSCPSMPAITQSLLLWCSLFRWYCERIQTFIDPYTCYASQSQWPTNETVLFLVLYARSVVRKLRWESSRWTQESFRLRNGARSIVPKSNSTMVQMHTRSGLVIQYFAVTLIMRTWSSELYKSTPMISFSFGPAI